MASNFIEVWLLFSFLGTLLLLAACSNTTRIENNHVVYQYDLPNVHVAQYAPGSTVKVVDDGKTRQAAGVFVTIQARP